MIAVTLTYYLGKVEFQTNQAVGMVVALAGDPVEANRLTGRRLSITERARCDDTRNPRSSSPVSLLWTTVHCRLVKRRI